MAQPSKRVSAGMEKVNGAHGIGGVEKGRLQIAGLGSPAAPSGICLGNQPISGGKPYLVLLWLWKK